MNSALVGCFELWRKQAAEEKKMRAKALKVLQRLMNSALVGSFERWREQAAEEKQMRAKAPKVVWRLMSRTLSVCVCLSLCVCLSVAFKFEVWLHCVLRRAA